MEKSTWFTELEEIFQQEKFSGLNSRYYRPEPFLKMVRKVEKFKEECPECKKFTDTITSTSRLLSKESPVSESLKMQYSGLFRELSSHLKKKHHLKTPGINASAFSLAGLVAGLIVWFVIKLAFGQDVILLNPNTDYLLLAFTGLIIGRYAGKRKDRKAEKLHQTLY